jgi:hypothetical protein
MTLRKSRAPARASGAEAETDTETEETLAQLVLEPAPQLSLRFTLFDFARFLRPDVSPLALLAPSSLPLASAERTQYLGPLPLRVWQGSLSAAYLSRAHRVCLSLQFHPEKWFGWLAAPRVGGGPSAQPLSPAEERVVVVAVADSLLVVRDLEKSSYSFWTRQQ